MDDGSVISPDIAKMILYSYFNEDVFSLHFLSPRLTTYDPFGIC